MIDISQNYRYNILDFGVWRSLVSRLVRVQEASGSNPDTPTIEKHWKCMFPVLFLTFWVHLRTSLYVRSTKRSTTCMF